ncbi:MAG: HD domain-containing protein [Bacteroidales bacterium]|nr:HD domain-containing protein [Bacteroidales bacterium]
MNPELKIWMDMAEAGWLENLYKHAKALFRNSDLPSHDHTHHIRVWNLCKSLLGEIATFNSGTDQSLVEGVLIAALFHDLGMVHSTREDHGKGGSGLCQSWFRETGRTKPERFEEILRAIELHDRKKVQIYNSFTTESPPGILEILSVADDLEAMGTIGIYRYAEIYLKRGIPMEELGIRVLRNAFARFENLKLSCRLCSRVLERFRPQYKELRHFYEQYNLQLHKTPEPESVQSGPLGVINCIRRGEANNAGHSHRYPELKDYFRKLNDELEQARL